jgi:DNA end-binding protein Ku
MPRAIWSGAISFGLVAVPVKLHPATEQKDIQFHQFKEGTQQRIKYKRVAEDSGREVDFEDIVKGYEVEKGKFVIVTPEELEGVAPERTKTIEIEDFVQLAEIDPIYFEKAYYLAPQGEAGAEKAYALLLKAMESEEMVAVGRFVMRTKEYLVTIRPKDEVLMLETMFFPDEIRATDEIEGLPVKGRVTDRELRMARQLIDSLATEWDASKYHDQYRERVLKLIKDKAKGKEVVLPEAPTPTKVADLMEALRQSIEATKKGVRPASPADGRRKATRRSTAAKRSAAKRSSAKRTAASRSGGRGTHRETRKKAS